MEQEVGIRFDLRGVGKGLARLERLLEEIGFGLRPGDLHGASDESEATAYVLANHWPSIDQEALRAGLVEEGFSGEFQVSHDGYHGFGDRPLI